MSSAETSMLNHFVPFVNSVSITTPKYSVLQAFGGSFSAPFSLGENVVTLLRGQSSGAPFGGSVFSGGQRLPRYQDSPGAFAMAGEMPIGRPPPVPVTAPPPMPSIPSMPSI